MSPTHSTREKFLDAASRLFAVRGFYGVSLADVAQELAMTKQAALYHFKTKEALYGAVLADVATRHGAVVAQARQSQGPASAKLHAYLGFLLEHALAHPHETQLVVRELLDNIDRTTVKRTWYMRGFLDDSVALLAEVPEWSARGERVQTAAVCQWVGAISYFVIAERTFAALWDRQRVGAAKAVFLDTLWAQAMAGVEWPVTTESRRG